MPGTALDALGTQLLCADPEETLLRRLRLSDAGLLITANSSFLADQTPQVLHINGPVKSFLPSKIDTRQLKILIIQASTDQLIKH